MSRPIAPLSPDEISAAGARLAGLAMQTPVIACEDGEAGRNVWLKLENLQPIGSYKIRPVGSAVMARNTADLSRGIFTASSGNSGLGLAWMGRRLAIPATVLVPPDAPAAKRAALADLGARTVELSYPDWWRVIETGHYPGVEGVYVDAVREPAALAGSGTIGVEIARQLKGLDAVFVPFGGGGLASGIACAIKAACPGVHVVACELDSACPMRAAQLAGAPVAIAARRGFISGVGYETVLPEMWPLVSAMIDATVIVTIEQVEAAIRRMALRQHIVAEGAGAIAPAAALFGHHRYQRICAVVSGGNIDAAELGRILLGGDEGG